MRGEEEEVIRKQIIEGEMSFADHQIDRFRIKRIGMMDRPYDDGS